MFERNTRSGRLGKTAIFAILCAVVLFSPRAFAQTDPWATVENLNVSPRKVAESDSDAFDSAATGIGTVGIGKPVYLSPKPTPEAQGPISGYTWTVTAEPNVGAAQIVTESDTLFKLILAEGGEYIITLTPLDSNGAATPESTIRLWAAEYLGVDKGSLSCGLCHFAIATPWRETAHARKLENHLNGVYNESYAPECLACHTVGSFADTRGDANFLEVAEGISFDLSQIPTWVDDAEANGSQNYDQLPGELKALAGVQCESCHGPGSTHMANITRITGAEFDAKSCSHCHDGVGRYRHYYDWVNSAHPGAHLADGGLVGSDPACSRCHTGEGFVEIAVRGKDDISNKYTSRSGVSCVACHDPHSGENTSQLRKIDPVLLANGEEFDAGLANLCVNCHNAQVADPEAAVDPETGSSEGAHHGPQADIFLGISAYGWGRPYPVGASIHTTALDGACVTCHMSPAAENATPDPPAIGGHSFLLNDEASGASNAASACGGCHAGLETTDRVTFSPQDYDGNGAAQGVQTEVAGLIENLKTELLARLASAVWDDEMGRILIDPAEWEAVTVEERGALYNFNLIAEDKSLGIHNTGYAVAVLQRSFLHLTGDVYDTAFPGAVMVDDERGAALSLDPPTNLSASDGVFNDRIEVVWDASQGATHYQVVRALSPGGERTVLGDWLTTTTYTDRPAEGTTFFYWVRAALGDQGEMASAFSSSDSGWIAPPTTSTLTRTYKITARRCSLAIDAAGNVAVGQTRPGSTVKIKALRGASPAGVDPTAPTTGTRVAYLRLAVIPSITVARTTGTTELAKFYTEAPVKTFDSDEAVGSMTAKGAAVERVRVQGFRRVKMSASPDSTSTENPAVALVSIESTGAPGKSGKITLTGIISRGLSARGQGVDSLKLAAKKNRSDTGERYVSFAGVEGDLVEARELGTLSVRGGAIAPSRIWTLTGDGNARLSATAGVFSLDGATTLTVRRGDIRTDLIDVAASSLRIEADGGDLKPHLVLASGAIGSASAEYRKIRQNGGGEYIGGELGLDAEDLATTGTLERLTASLEPYMTTSTLADIKTTTSVFVSGISGKGSRDIRSVFGARGVTGVFIAGAASRVRGYGIDLEIAPNLEGRLRKVATRQPGPYGEPAIAGESWSRPGKNINFKGDREHSGFIEHSSAPAP